MGVLPHAARASGQAKWVPFLTHCATFSTKKLTHTHTHTFPHVGFYSTRHHLNSFLEILVSFSKTLFEITLVKLALVAVGGENE